MKAFYSFFLFSILLVASSALAQTRHLPKALSRVSRLTSATARASKTAAEQPRQQVRYSWDVATASWVLPRRDVVSFDTQGRVIEIITSDSATTVPFARVAYTYDAAGNLLEQLTQTGNGSPWTNVVRYVSTYDAQGLQTEELGQEWVNGAWQTKEGYRYQNTYQGGILSEQVVQLFDKGTFLDETRFQYTISNGRWSEVVAQRLENGNWVNDEKLLDFTWHDWDARNPSFYRVQTWNNGQWKNFQRATLTYATTGTTVTLLESALPDGNWQNFLRLTLPFDAQGNSLGYREENWTNNSWTLSAESRNLLRYDASNRLVRLTEQVYSPVTAQFSNTQRINYSNFQDVVTSTTARHLSERLLLYPSPAAATAQLELDGLPDQRTLAVEVHTLTGQLVWTTAAPVRQGRLSTSLQLQQLAPGIYLVKIPTAQGVVVRRFVHE